jgi:predicted Fe-S protein YdhL (DUF1289 family)
MKLGCCSAISPCSHQQRDPNSLCETCQRSADEIAATIQDREVRNAIRFLTRLGYTIEPPPIKWSVPHS